jgi:hypothetical protein
MNDSNNHLMEVITVRLNTCRDTQSFQGIMKEVAKLSSESSEFDSIKLYKSELVENDWAIYLHYPAVEKEGKSSLAARLTEVLHSVGLVHHQLWRPCDIGDIDKLFKNLK